MSVARAAQCGKMSAARRGKSAAQHARRSEAGAAAARAQKDIDAVYFRLCQAYYLSLFAECCTPLFISPATLFRLLPAAAATLICHAKFVTPRAVSCDAVLLSYVACRHCRVTLRVDIRVVDCCRAAPYVTLPYASVDDALPPCRAANHAADTTLRYVDAISVYHIATMSPLMVTVLSLAPTRRYVDICLRRDAALQLRRTSRYVAMLCYVRYDGVATRDYYVVYYVIALSRVTPLADFAIPYAAAIGLHTDTSESSVADADVAHSL